MYKYIYDVYLCVRVCVCKQIKYIYDMSCYIAVDCGC